MAGKLEEGLPVCGERRRSLPRLGDPGFEVDVLTDEKKLDNLTKGVNWSRDNVNYERAQLYLQMVNDVDRLGADTREGAAVGAANVLFRADQAAGAAGAGNRAAGYNTAIESMPKRRGLFQRLFQRERGRKVQFAGRNVQFAQSPLVIETPFREKRIPWEASIRGAVEMESSGADESVFRAEQERWARLANVPADGAWTPFKHGFEPSLRTEEGLTSALAGVTIADMGPADARARLAAAVDIDALI